MQKKVGKSSAVTLAVCLSLSLAALAAAAKKCTAGARVRPQQETGLRLNLDSESEGPQMTLAELMETVPSYARDLKLNFSMLSQQKELTEQQIWGTIVASAIASRSPELTRAVVAEAALHLSPQALEAAKSAAAIMGMNNVYYRFQHLTSNEHCRTMPARLRMNVLRSPGVDHLDFELWSAAASAIKGCEVCVDSHEKVVRDKGLSEDAVLAAIHLASVIHGLATVFDAEEVEVREALAV
jgi:alkyl hydroperoxide reductase subunit D